MTITLENYKFSGPFKYTRGIKDGLSGVYAIMVITGQENGKSLYQLIYVGQTHDFAERLTENHHKYDCFKKQAKKHESEIYRGLYFMTDSSEEERIEVESKLIQKRNLICNDT